MSFLSIRWLLPKLIFLKALCGLAGATAHLVIKVYDARNKMQATSSTPTVSSSVISPSDTVTTTLTENIEAVELEDPGEVMLDEDGFSY